MTRAQSIAQEVEYRESNRRKRYGMMPKGPYAPVKDRLIVPYIVSDIEQLLREHLFNSDGLGSSVHTDDISQRAVGMFYANGSVDGLPIRRWNIESTLERINKDRETILAINKKRKK